MPNFPLADLGPERMPRQTYPEPPRAAPTPSFPERIPGGMLHANLGLPRPPPRNFQLSCGQHTPRHRSNPQEKNNIVIPEFSAWLTLVLEQCRAENIRNLPLPAGSHALISRTPTPGGMLHVNLGLPRPPPRNFQLSCGQEMPDTGATPKKKTTSSFRNFPRGWPPSWNDAARKISGISRASGLPRPYFQNADPGRHAPCQSRAATTSPSQLSTSPPATALQSNRKRIPQCPPDWGQSFSRLRGGDAQGGMRRRGGGDSGYFHPLSRKGGSGMTMIFLTLDVAPVSPGILSHPQEWSFGAVPPQERWHEGVG